MLLHNVEISRESLHYAHSTPTPDGSNWQPLRDHLKQTALRAKMFGSKFGAAKAAALAGWLHDLGKYSEAYQAYIAGRGPGGVDHSTAGAQEVLKLGLKGADKGMAELIAYAIAGHHAGLPDMIGADGEASALADRLGKRIPPLRDWRLPLAGPRCWTSFSAFWWPGRSDRQRFAIDCVVQKMPLDSIQ
jgi:CRISPR-associated endonuclease/helicase Cas3